MYLGIPELGGGLPHEMATREQPGELSASAGKEDVKWGWRGEDRSGAKEMQG